MESHLECLCRGLKDRVDLKVLVANDAPKNLDERVDGVDVSRIGTWFEFASSQVCPDLARQIRSHPADIVHLHWPNPTAVLAYFASGHPGRLIVTYHSDIIRQRTLGTVFSPVLHTLLRRSAAIVCTSPNYIDSSPVLQKHRHRCRIIRFGIPLDGYDAYDMQASAAIRRQYGPRIVLAVGRHVYYKGFEYLIRAMARIDGLLLMAGNGPLRETLQKEAVLRGVQERVVFLGPVEDVVPYLHAADVFVMPSIARSEAFGIAQLEAMACSKPVVNTSLDSGVPFVSPNGVTGITVPPKSEHALADAITTLLDNGYLRAQYGRAARMRVQQEFSLEVMTSRTLDLYNEVLGSRPTEQSSLELPGIDCVTTFSRKAE